MSDKRNLGDSVPAEAWRKFHKVTPIAKGGMVWVVLAIAVYNILQQILENGMDGFTDLLDHITWLIGIAIFGGLIVLTLLVILFSWVSWKYQSFAIVDSGIHKRTGVLIKNHSHMRWDRVQTVEVEQRLFGRIFGFGSVKIESAGSEPATELGLLTMEYCAKLRKEVLTGLANARAGRPIGMGLSATDVVGREPGTELPAAVGQPADGVVDGSQAFGQAAGPVVPIFDPDDTENDRLIFELPTSRLIAAQFLSMGAVITIVGTIVVIGVSIWLHSALMAMVVLLFGAVVSIVQSGLAAYGTKVYISENGLRVRAGLTKLTTRSMPPARMHAIELHRPILWRWKDWWKVSATLAGGNALENAGEATKAGIVIPVGTREEALQTLWTMLPDAGTDDDAALIRDALDGLGTGRFFLSAPGRAKWFDPITYKSRGICLTPRVAVIRRGRFSRKVTFVWQDHTQSLRMSQGPIQRRLQLGDINFDMVNVQHYTRHKNMAIDEVERMIWVENDLTAKARHVGVSESIDDWRERVRV
ncbi:PH domain-containing protein [Trueperella pecoris]|uniref:PH domain-containing protein n=1 Tax=Trueperella pecoris TaxID=2733571 RepID=UPI001ABE7E5C|nr:PH domain-containing protein [Trueperella pecoris]QTG75845.1 PH domain-containing protein [Trueperella pecoris]